MRTRPVPTCPICRSAGAPCHQRLPDHSNPSSQLWSFRRCRDRHCGHYWLDPVPVPEDLHMAYESYGPHQDPLPAPVQRYSPLGRAYQGFLTVSGMRKRRQRLYLYDLPPGKGRRLLEVGCGNGARLLALKEHGWEVEGQDASARAVEVARKHAQVPVHPGPIETLRLPPDSFDAIVMNHVIEHVYDPVAVLRHVSAMLRPGGILVSIHPNGSSSMHQLMGRHWVGLDAPRHLHAFTLSSMRLALQKAGLPHAKIRATSVGTEFWFPQSRAFRRIHTGKPPIPRNGTITGPLSQLLATLVHPLAPRRGEEMVVTAIRPGTRGRLVG